MKLTILICSLQKRLQKFASLCGHLQQQAEKYPDQVEILWLGDNKTMSVGEKRNKLLGLAKGEYVCFVDDDDWVADNYVEQIMLGIATGADCICFNAWYTTDTITAPLNPPIRGKCDGAENVQDSLHPKDTLKVLPNGEDLGGALEGRNGASILVEYSLSNLLNVDEPNKPRLRVPNHLIPIKRELALKTMFLDKSFGEDTDYGLRIRRLLKIEYRIKEPLYHYRFSVAESETHKHSPKFKRPVSRPMMKMDVVMVSDAACPLNPPRGGEYKEEPLIMTQNAINSIASPEVNIVVLERSSAIRYANADTFLQREPFNYNQCLNNGAGMGNAQLLCFTNNDVVFPHGFLHSVLDTIQQTGADVISFANQQGFLHADIISGFCFVITRKAYYKIGKLNETYPFWCADNVTSEQIKQHGLKEVKSPLRVTHLTSVTLKKLDEPTREAYTRGCVKAFNRDYDRNVLNMGK